MDERHDVSPPRSPLTKALLSICWGSSAGAGLLGFLGVLMIVGMATGRRDAGPWLLPLVLAAAVCASTVAGLARCP